ncbi:MAG: hypothetical protein OEV44_15450, partial [Spirochaetota bacterium]|nr:hypothetical protein [Spirochaetota bacterium]
KTRKAINIATKLEAYKDNEMQPIVSEVESYKRTENGHEIYTILAPYILLKINEEEDIKVATVNSLSDVLDEKRSKRGLIIGLAIFLIVLIVIIAILSNLK